MEYGKKTDFISYCIVVHILYLDFLLKFKLILTLFSTTVALFLYSFMN
jgi:hypothetical protein